MTATAAPTLVDQDGGLDDALALALLVSSPAARLVAVTSVHGNVTAPAAAANAARVLELYEHRHVPIAIGADAPLAKPPHLAHPRDPLRHVIGAPRTNTPCAEAADELILRQARTHAGELDILAIGPLTNIATALRAEPKLPRLVRRLVVMGGAFEHPGNLTVHAEANIGHDPEAAASVLAADFATTVVPLDLTRTVTATRRWLVQLVRTAPSIRMKTTAALLVLAAPRRALRLHDAVAAAVLLDPAIVTATRSSPVRITLEPGPHHGQSRHASGSARPVETIVRAVDGERVRVQLLMALT
ncbi:nucleoside hydrolase [Amycolatopsis antarctica]|uniref:Nucleoside hydrolase n=1 Tax=Amycolatopsis antarctica TaxID=1854586 RepID=A0A263CZ40_9PSEU|nr:nucleoside hydrolase [Amycolatopsis antarctica]OZM70365.1 nucleoside hydrolase [Amycolatopsis antarctica]